MTMTTIQLQALRARLWAAKVSHQLIGGAAGYVEALEAEAGPMDFDDFDGVQNSPDHLLALVEKVLQLRSAPKTLDKSEATSKPTHGKSAHEKKEPKKHSKSTAGSPSEPSSD